MKLEQLLVAQLAGQPWTQTPSKAVRPVTQVSQSPFALQRVQFAMEQRRQVELSTSWKEVRHWLQAFSVWQVAQLLMSQGTQA